MLILLGLFSLCLGQDLALVEVRPTDGSEGSFKFCVGYGQDYGYDKELPTDAAHSDLTFEFDDLTELGSLALCKNYTDNDSIDSSGGAALVKRGNCTFQEKATTWKNRNGNGLITVNTEDSIFPPGVSNSSASDLQMFVAIMANSSYYDLESFAKSHNGFSSLRGALYALPKQSKFDPTLICVWFLAMICVTIGTQLSADGVPQMRRSSAGSLESQVIIDDVETDKDEHQEITAKTGAIWLCVTTGWLLLLYMLYDYLVFIMIGIFCFCGALAMGHVLFCVVLNRFACTNRYTFKQTSVSWPFLDCIPRLICRAGYPIAGVILYGCCFAFTITWFFNRHSTWGWILQDVIGFFFCIYTICELRLPNFKMLTFLLIGFAIYDLFMVYVTPLLTPSKESVMVYVATGGDNPEKMPFLFLMPHLRQSDVYDLCHQPAGFSMLGFGDLIIPGFLGGYALYFDVFNDHRHYYYWWTFIISYGAGLIMTFGALIIMNSGQPALVFIVPATLSSLLLCALVRREMSHFWNGPKVKESLS